MTLMKQIIIVRSDLKMGKGKMAAQVAHASVDATLKAGADVMKDWRKDGMGKIVVKIENQDKLYKYIQHAKDAGLITAIISDAGRTQLEPGTVTCGAIGPGDDEKIDKICKDLSLM